MILLMQNLRVHKKMYSRSKKKKKKKKKKKTIYFKTNYPTEIKLVRIIMDYSQLQFDAFKFFLWVRLHWGYLSNFNFFI